ncbi:MAG: DUF501 domain-containing protein [Nitriliruptorales bacterium]
MNLPPPADDALREDGQASYSRAEAASKIGHAERAVVSAQLGRPARGDIAVAHRCIYGLPTVVRVSPRLEDGTPFPTVFWLVCPLARRRVGRMESEGSMTAVNQRLARDSTLAAGYEAAAERYIAFRDRIDAPLPGTPAAGGMPTYVKCLHVQVAHFLATGDNPVGAGTYHELAPMPCPGPCVDEQILAAAYGSLPPPSAFPGGWTAAAPPQERPRPSQRGTSAPQAGA